MNMNKLTYPNFFERIGKNKDEVQKRLEKDFSTIFLSEDRIYHEDGDNYGYMVDTGNHDVRSEGQSYGMMIALQMNKQHMFDCIWRWTKKYMLIKEGDNKGYFGWSAQLDGTLNSTGPAPDGEEFFAMALLFASNRWKSNEFDYAQDAKDILHAMIHNKEPMFNPDNKLIKFVPNMEISDPSYHLPHFYELFALWGSQADKNFFKEATVASREYLKKACHPETGLSAEYADYDGRPYNLRNHHLFYSDAYRTGANISLDALWFGATEFHKTQANAILNWFSVEERLDIVCHIDGTPATPEEQVTEIDGKPLGVLHPLGLLATLATSAIIIEGELGDKFLQKLWDSEPRIGNRRYYDNLLYFFALLALSGNYKIYV
ncbi:MAG: glycosyl hydrolase family 8 [Defluviitaleaceae bacterium]|nr:glycosyl hydrolase family 8 [Defluviitaleaceae bacterium]